MYAVSSSDIRFSVNSAKIMELDVKPELSYRVLFTVTDVGGKALFLFSLSPGWIGST